jgi:GNAT superfamily N-acetyltransferase
MPPALLTTRRAVPADAETLVRTSRLGQETWRAFAPAGWTQREHDERIAFVREIVGHPHGVALLAHVAGEPAGHFAMVPGYWNEPRAAILVALFVRPAFMGTGLADHLHAAFIAAAGERGYPWAWLSTPAGHARARRFYERRGWRADTLVEVHDGMPWAIYGRPLLPVAGAARENPVVDAGVRSRP